MQGVLFIHGFNSEYEDYKPFIEDMNYIYQVDTHYFILPGHGNGKLEKVNYEQWLLCAEEELNKLFSLYDKVSIIGHSMGGIIGSYLAAKYPNVEKLVLVAPAFEMFNFRQNIKDFKKRSEKEDKTLDTFFKKLLTTSPYTFKELLRMIKERAPIIEEVTCPILLIHGDQDEIINIDASYRAFDRIKAPKIFTIVKRGRHKLLKGKHRFAIEEIIVPFLKKKRYRKKYDYKEI